MMPTFQGGMKAETSESYKKITQEGDYKYHLMSMFPAIMESSECEIYKKDICQRVYNLSNISCGIILLMKINQTHSGKDHTLTSSHQFKVAVIGYQYPFSIELYGIDGSFGNMILWLITAVIRISIRIFLNRRVSSFDHDFRSRWFREEDIHISRTLAQIEYADCGRCRVRANQQTR